MIPIICFTSDFGLQDSWVGVCHATMYRSCPQARVVDLAHRIDPYDIRKGAFVAASGVWQLPKAVHLVCVDPGVGGGRADLVLVTGTGTVMVGPDNGVLMLSTWRAGGVSRAYSIDAHILRPRPPLATFHARDVLAPAVAALASGVSPEALGEPAESDDLVPAPFARPVLDSGSATTEVLDVDRFGSVRLGLSPDDLEDIGAEGTLEVSVGHSSLAVPFGATFSDVAVHEPVALVDSSGWLTLALREGDAAERFGIERGMEVTVRNA